MANVIQWDSEYSRSSSGATNGKLREAFRSKKEIKKYISKRKGKVESITVHRIPKSARFEVKNVMACVYVNRVFYAWTGGIRISANDEKYVLEEDGKIFVDPRHAERLVIGNRSGGTGLVVEVSSYRFSESAYLGERVKHFAVLRRNGEIEEDLEGELRQVTVHNFGKYDLGGNHYHLDGKIEGFTVVEGSVHTFERTLKRGEESKAGFGNLAQRVKFHKVVHDEYHVGGSFVFEPTDGFGNYISHAIVAGRNGAKVVETSNIAFNPTKSSGTIIADVIVPKEEKARRRILSDKKLLVHY